MDLAQQVSEGNSEGLGLHCFGRVYLFVCFKLFHKNSNMVSEWYVFIKVL